MIVSHGTTLEIQKPDIFHSKQYLDFGVGFYVTSFQVQAERWALRKGMRLSMPGIVNIYEVSNFSKIEERGRTHGRSGKWKRDFSVSVGLGYLRKRPLSV